MTTGAHMPNAPATLSRHARHAWLAPRTLLAITLVLSTLAHVIAYWGLPDFTRFMRVDQDAVFSRFDAVLVASAKDPAIRDTPLADAAPQPVPKPTKPRLPRPAAKPLERAASAAPMAEFAPAPILIAEDSVATNSSAAAAESITPTEPAPSRPNEPDYTPRVAETTPEPQSPVALTPAATAAATGSAREQTSTEKPADFPGRISIGYRMTSNVADGVANISWKREGDQYEIDSTVQPSGIFTSMFVGTFRQVSRGDITAAGVRPRFFSLKRGEARADTAEFLRATNELKIIKHGETHLLPLSERMQDMQSFLFQMAHDVGITAGAAETVTVQVTNARKVYEYKFRRIGEESVETKMGKISAIHLKSEASNPEDVYEVWLAPDRHYMPVKLKFFMGRFPVEQTVNSFSSSK
jgi:hypothetical protein